MKLLKKQEQLGIETKFVIERPIDDEDDIKISGFRTARASNSRMGFGIPKTIEDPLIGKTYKEEESIAFTNE